MSYYSARHARCHLFTWRCGGAPPSTGATQWRHETRQARQAGHSAPQAQAFLEPTPAHPPPSPRPGATRGPGVEKGKVCWAPSTERLLAPVPLFFFYPREATPAFHGVRDQPVPEGSLPPPLAPAPLAHAPAQNIQTSAGQESPRQTGITCGPASLNNPRAVHTAGPPGPPRPLGR